MPITRDALDLQAELDQQVAHVLDEQSRDLVRAWAHAWDEVSYDLRVTLEDIAADYETGDPIPRSAFARSTRLALVLGVIDTQLGTLTDRFGVRVTRDLPNIVATAADAQVGIIRAMLPSGYRLVGRVEATALAAIVRRATEQITSPDWHLSEQAYDAVRRELIRGVAAGSGPRDVAASMVSRSEHGFNGGLSRALGIARTEVLDAHRVAAQYGQSRHADVLASWTWLAHLTPATCRSCIANNGQTFPLDVPGPIDHQQGRCARMPTVRSWSELGVDDAEEPDDVGVPDAEAWFAGLSEAEQRSILGPRGFAAWRRGDYPMSAWSTRRSTDGWRDSLVPSAAPA